MTMCKQDFTIYDIKPRYMENYLRYYGEHFNKALCDFAVSKMKKQVGDKKVKIEPYTKNDVDVLLKKYNVVLENNEGYDYVFVANMCKADYLGDSVPNEEHLAKYVKNVIDDPDGYDGIAFNRWYADTCKTGVVIEWEDMI